MPANDLSVAARAARIRLLAFDVDGSLTDGAILIGAQGEMIKRFSVHDGLAITWLPSADITPAIITGRQSEIVLRRAAELRITHVAQGVPDKVIALRQLQATLGLDGSQTAFFGDDWPDLAAMQHCAISGTVAGAPAALKEQADFVANRPAGDGAARQFIEWLLSARGQLDAVFARYQSKGHLADRA